MEMDDMNTIHEHQVLRLKQIVGCKKSVPPVPPIIPISASSWWAGVKEGRYPSGIKLGPKTTVWRARDIEALINGAGGEK